MTMVQKLCNRCLLIALLFYLGSQSELYFNGSRRKKHPALSIPQLHSRLFSKPLLSTIGVKLQNIVYAFIRELCTAFSTLDDKRSYFKQNEAYMLVIEC